jgi:hypothetical protein
MMNGIAKLAKNKALVIVVIINVIASFGGPILFDLTGRSQPLIPIIALFVTIVTMIVTIAIGQKEKNKLKAARERLYA